MESTSATTLNITIEFGGGTEFLTATKKTKKHQLQVSKFIADQNNINAEGTAEKAEDKSAIVAPASTNSEAAKSTSEHPANMRDLVQVVLQKLITERHSMLIEPDGSIRPGIMVLINDADWELEGEMEYELQDDDHVCFISTLHGG